jgi:hypothetical protein
VNPRSSQNCLTETPLRACALIRSRQSSPLLPTLLAALALVMEPLCGVTHVLGRGVHRTLTPIRHAPYTDRLHGWLFVAGLQTLLIAICQAFHVCLKAGVPRLAVNVLILEVRPENTFSIVPLTPESGDTTNSAAR